MSDEQRRLLDRFVEMFLDGENDSLPGTTLRLAASGVARNERARLVRSLAPRYARVAGTEPNQDYWTPTFEGLLQSNSSAFATKWIGWVLCLMREKATSEGAFVRYVWPELKEVAARSGDEPNDRVVPRVALVIGLAGLQRGASRLPAPEHWYWGRPERFEELLEISTAGELLAFRQSHIAVVVRLRDRGRRPGTGRMDHRDLPTPRTAQDQVQFRPDGGAGLAGEDSRPAVALEDRGRGDEPHALGGEEGSSARRAWQCGREHCRREGRKGGIHVFASDHSPKPATY